MMRIYKYLSRKRLQEFKEHGSVKINTVRRLRYEHEKIRDEFEGRRKVKVGSKDHTLTYTGEEFNRLFPQIKSNRPNVELTLDRGAFILDTKQVTNAFVFCASLIMDWNLCKKFGYDAYYTIENPYRFAEILYEKINEVRPLIGFKADRVRYSNKEIVFTDKMKSLSENLNDFWDICFTKPTKFSDEKEFRMVFVPEGSGEISFLILKCPELRKCCPL